MATREQLLAVSPIDGRYGDKVKPLEGITSEYGLIKYRLAVEAGWLGVLGSGILPDRKPLSKTGQRYLEGMADDFSVEDALEVKAIEDVTRHDVNALVRWMTDKLTDVPAFRNYSELAHLGATSEDINNLAYAMMVRDVRDKVLVPGIKEVSGELQAKAHQYADIPMLSHTHGQPATPSTMGKEMGVFAERLVRSRGRLGSVAISGKFNGATGSYNALTFTYPEVDWPKVSKDFVESLGFDVHHATTQIEPHDWLAAFNNELALSNTIMTDTARDMWSYISMGYFKQEVKKDEVGSSTMPNKVNPIDFENAEANFGAANAMLGFLSAKLPISRLQRDLSDSSALRTLGEAYGHTLIAHSSIKRAFGKVHPDAEKMAQDLNSDWAVLTEAVQIMLRRYGVVGAYDEIRAAARGKTMTEADYLRLVAKLDLPHDPRIRLAELSPATYIGRASEIARGTDTLGLDVPLDESFSYS
jgi:adenylosuccinate lyase